MSSKDTLPKSSRPATIRVKLRVFGELATVLGHNRTVELDQETAIIVLTNKIAEDAGLARKGYLGKYKVGGEDLAILVNGKNICLLDGTKTTLHDGDEVVILPPTAGG